MTTTDQRTDDKGSGTLKSAVSGVREMASRNPATERLMREAEGYLEVQAHRLLGNVGERVGSATSKLTDVGEGRSSLGGVVAKAGAATAKDKLASLVGKGKSGSGRQKTTQIIEDIDVGVPVDVAYNQ